MKTFNEQVQDFIKFMGQHSSLDDFTTKALTNEDRTQAEEDLQDELLNELENEIYTGHLITWEHDSDGDQMNVDNLIEWLRMYYRIEKK